MAATDEGSKVAFNEKKFFISTFSLKKRRPGTKPICQRRVYSRIIGFAGIAKALTSSSDYVANDHRSFWLELATELNLLDQDIIGSRQEHVISVLRKCAHCVCAYLDEEAQDRDSSSGTLRKMDVRSSGDDAVLGREAAMVGPDPEVAQASTAYIQNTASLDEEDEHASSGVELNARKFVIQILDSIILNKDLRSRISEKSSQAKIYNDLFAKLERHKYALEDNTMREIVMLGPTGVGKTFLINMLLYMTQVPGHEYGNRNWAPDSASDDVESSSEYQNDDAKSLDCLLSQEITDNNTEIDDDDRTEPESETLKLKDLRAYIKNSSQSLPNLIQIQPEHDMFSDLDLRREELALDCIRAFRSESERQGLLEKMNGLGINVNRRDQETQRFARRHIRSFILASAPERANMPTTSTNLEIVYGNTWRAEVIYYSLDELRQELGRFDFRDKPQSADSVARLSYDRKVGLLKAVLDENKVPQVTAEGDGEGEEPGTSSPKRIRRDPWDMDDGLRWIPRYSATARDDEVGRDIPFKREVEAIAGKTLEFVSRGNDAMKDRMFIRRALNGILFQGLAEDANTGNGWPDELVAGDGAPQRQSVDVNLIKRVKLYAPSLLLQQNVKLTDIPGTNDSSVERTHNMRRKLKTCAGVMIIANKDTINGDDSLRNVLLEEIGPRLFADNGRERPRLTYFLQGESSLPMDMEDLEDPTFEEKDLSEAEHAIINAVLKIESTVHGEMWRKSTEDLHSKAKKSLENMLQDKAREVRPLAYASLMRGRAETAKDLHISLDALDKTNGDAVLRFIMDVGLGDFDDRIKAVIKDIKNDNREAIKREDARSVDIDLTQKIRDSRNDFRDFWAGYIVPRVRGLELSVLPARTKAVAELEDIIRERTKGYFEKVRGDVMTRIGNAKRLPKIAEAFHPTASTKSYIARDFPVVIWYCASLEKMDLLLEDMKSVIMLAVAEEISNRVFRSGIFKEFHDGVGKRLHTIMSTEADLARDAVYNALANARASPQNALDNTITKCLRQEFQRCAARHFGQDKAVVVDRNDARARAEAVHREFISGAPAQILRGLVSFVHANVLGVVCSPFEFTTNSLFRYFNGLFPSGSSANVGRRKALEEAQDLLSNINRRLTALAHQTKSEARVLALEAKIVSGFFEIPRDVDLSDIVSRLPEGYIATADNAVGPVNGDTNAKNQLIGLRNLLAEQAGMSSTSIANVIFKAMGVRDSETCATLAKYWPKYLENAYFRYPNVEDKNKFGFPLSDAWESLRGLEGDSLHSALEDMFLDPKHQVVLLHGACEAFGMVARVKVVARDEDTPKTFSISYATPRMTGKISSILLQLDLSKDAPEWSAMKEVRQRRL